MRKRLFDIMVSLVFLCTLFPFFYRYGYQNDFPEPGHVQAAKVWQGRQDFHSLEIPYNETKRGNRYHTGHQS